MRYMKLNIRLVAFLAVVVVAVVAVGSLLPGQTLAQTPTPTQTPTGVTIDDPTGVYCADLTVTLPGPVEVAGIILARFDYVMGFDFDLDVDGIQDTAISAVAYAPEATATCQTIGSIPGNLVPQTAARPSLTGEWTDGTDTVTGSTCSEDTEFGGITFPGWTKIEIDFGVTKTKDQSAFSFDNPPYTDENCDVVDTEITGLGTLNVAVEGFYLDGPDAAKGTFDSDWDNDGCLDWNELDPDPKLLPLDPFNAADCEPGVGGIAELPAVAGTSPDAVASSDNNAGLIAAAAAATAAGALAFGSAAAYARRRSDQ